MTTEWHLDSETIESYRANALSAAMAASLEAHVVACGRCRELVTARSDATRAATNWSAIADRIDVPRRNVAQRGLERLGLREHIARLITLTPTFHLAWLGALALISMLAIGAGVDRTLLRADRGTFLFLVVAPLLPVLGVAAAFGRQTDPAHELTITAPISAFELVLVRTAAVLATSVPVTLVASLGLPGSNWSATAWLLPALGLTTTTLALARWVHLRVAAAGLSAVWLLAALVATRGEAAAQLVHDYPAFAPPGQIGFVVLSLLAVVSLSATRHTFDLRRTS